MSVASKRRFITNKVETEMYTPEVDDVIGIVRGARGNNLHEVEDENGDIFVASMPSKFRKAVWIRRGQFVVLRPISEGDKVKAEIEHVLDEENVLYIHENKKWPKRFEAQAIAMTRDARRGGTASHPTIDDDMLPPSESEDDEEEEAEGEDSDKSCVDDGSNSEENEDSSEDEKVDNTYNPNRSQAPCNR